VWQKLMIGRKRKKKLIDRKRGDRGKGWGKKRRNVPVDKNWREGWREGSFFGGGVWGSCPPKLHSQNNVRPKTKEKCTKGGIKKKEETTP